MSGEGGDGDKTLRCESKGEMGQRNFQTSPTSPGDVPDLFPIRFSTFSVLKFLSPSLLSILFIYLFILFSL